MPASPTAKVPPARVVRAIGGARARLQRLNQRMAPAPMALLEMIQGSMITQAIYTAAKLGIADTLGDTPKTAGEIAQKVGADPDATYRLLRLLASYSIFAEQNDGRFKLTPMAEALRSDAPMTMRGMALLMGHPMHWEDWSHLMDTVRTGEPSMPRLRGMSAFEYLAANPEYAEVFNNAFGGLSDLETEPIMAAYDFSRFGTIVDVAGGYGGLLAAILKRVSNSRGVLFDDRAAADGGGTIIEQAGVADRCSIKGGSIFGSIPSGADAYILKHILHDWPEPKAVDILKNIRAAMNPDSTLLVMEYVVTAGNGQDISKLVDLWLLLLVGGKERTGAQYGELLEKAGFRLDRVVKTASPLSIMEARPD